jgi:hypothetical protein
MDLSSKQKGNLTELQCITAMCACGCQVCLPYGDNAKYDFIADVGGRLIKIQVKTSSPKGTDAFKFSCRTTHLNCAGVKNERYSEKDVDYCATYYLGKGYLVPIKECSVEKTLRFDYPSSGQKQGITLAYEYEMEKQIQRIKEEVAEH